MNIEFDSSVELMIFCLDYFTQIHLIFPNLRLEMDSNRNYVFNCTFCQVQHIIGEQEAGSSCVLLKELEKYFVYLKNLLDTFFSRVYSNYVSRQNKTYSLILEKVNSLSGLGYQPMALVIDLLDYIKFSCYPDY